MGKIQEILAKNKTKEEQDKELDVLVESLDKKLQKQAREVVKKLRKIHEIVSLFIDSFIKKNNLGI